MSDVDETLCPSCGSPNLGTRFCENCGQPAPAVGAVQAAPTISPASAPAHPHTVTSAGRSPNGSPLNAITLVSYLAYLVVPTIGYMVLSSGGRLYYFDQGWSAALQVLSVGLWLVSGISATIAGFTSRTTAGRRVGGGLLGVLYLLLLLLAFLGGFSGTYWLSYGTILAPLALFFSWAIARPFRGPGYFALLIGIAVSALGFAVGLIPPVQYNYVLSAVIGLLVGVVATVVTVASAVGFEEHARLRALPMPVAVAGAPTAAFAPYGYAGPPGYPVRPTNGLAVASLILGIVGGGVIAVILGHVAKSQIRRTGEAGDGMATAGLILGYFWLVIGLILIIVYVAQFMAIFGALGSFRGY